MPGYAAIRYTMSVSLGDLKYSAVLVVNHSVSTLNYLYTKQGMMPSMLALPSNHTVHPEPNLTFKKFEMPLSVAELVKLGYSS